MTLNVVLTLSVPLLTAVAAILWAAFVADGLDRIPEIDGAERSCDLRTW